MKGMAKGNRKVDETVEPFALCAERQRQADAHMPGPRRWGGESKGKQSDY